MSNIDPNLDNPYRAPTVLEVATPDEGSSSDAADIRTRHLTHEASLQGIGSLYVLGGVIALISAAFLVYGIAGMGAVGVFELIICAFLLVVGLCQMWVGMGLRKVQPWTKTPATVLAVLGLLSFPIGTLVNVYVLWLVHSEKGHVVLAPSYQNVIAQTPDIKYRTSIVVKVLACILLALIGFAVAASIFS